MKGTHASNSKQTTNTSYINWIWNYGKQAVKGLSVMSLGVLGYMGLRGYWRSDNAITQTNSESTNLVSASDTSTAIVDKGLTSIVSGSVTRQNVWDMVGQSVQYRHKRGVVPLGEEFQVNTNTISGSHSVIASLPNGEFVITWGSLNPGYNNISAQRFDVNGVRLGNEFQVNTNGQYQVIASLPNGGFVISWQAGSSPYNIYVQRFDVNGAPISNAFQVTNTANNVYPAIVALPNGEFVITWQCRLNVAWNVYAQRFDVNGAPIGNTFQVNTNTINARSPAVASLPNGVFVITWAANKIAAQRFVNGTRLNNEFQVSTNISGVQPAIASLPNGRFVITWVSLDPSLKIYAQRFDTNGTPIGNAFQVNTNTINNQTPAIANLPNGEFVITWRSSGGAPYSIYAQRFDVNGARLGSEFQVNTAVISNSIASLPNNNFVITWGIGGYPSNIYARLFTILYTPSELNRNSLIIDQGQTLVLTPLQLLASTESVPLSNVILMASNVAHGWFANVNNSTVPIFNFTQVEVNNGQIQFTQDDSYNTPGYQIAVFDGINMTAPQSAVVDFDQKPLWINNQIPIANRRQVQLSFKELLATDDKTNSQVFFEVRNVSHGAFAFSSVANPLINPINNFTQLQVNASQINFAHDGSNIAPSCSIRASDGRLYTTYQPCQFLFTPNQAPQLILNELTLVKGEAKVIDGKSLAAIKPDATAEEFNQLMFNFTVVQHGQFVLTTNSNQTVAWAQQNQITAGYLLFKHDGSDQAPSYNVTVSDAFNVTASQKANVTFSLLPPPSNTVTRDDTKLITGAAVGATGGALLLVGLGIFGAYRYRRRKQLEEQRSNNPLANAIYHELKIPGTEDFLSENGIAFTNAVDTLNNELIRAGVDIKEMVPEEINELAHKLANATKAQLGEEINPLDIQDYAQGIVATAMTLSRKNKVDDPDAELNRAGSSKNNEEVLLSAFKKYLQKKNTDLEAMSLNEIDSLVKPLLDADDNAQLKV